jgi:hypothetical protein
MKWCRCEQLEQANEMVSGRVIMSGGGREGGAAEVAKGHWVRGQPQVQTTVRVWVVVGLVLAGRQVPGQRPCTGATETCVVGLWEIARCNLRGRGETAGMSVHEALNEGCGAGS